MFSTGGHSSYSLHEYVKPMHNITNISMTALLPPSAWNVTNYIELAHEK